MTRSAILAAVTLIWACTASEVVRDQGEWLAYEPAVVELAGVLRLTQRFGPPNFGETPELDSTVVVPLLTLAQPIKVRGNLDAAMNNETYEGLEEIQLVLSQTLDLSLLVDRELTITGTLFQKHTGHHFTDVLMNVKSFVQDSIP